MIRKDLIENDQKLRELLKNSVQDIISTGKYKEFMECMANFPSYSYNNQLLIFMQKPNAKKVQSFNRWKKLGTKEQPVHVKQGEKGIVILAPILIKEKDKDGNVVLDENGNEKIAFVKYRHVYVFAEDQVEGYVLPSLTNELEGDVARYDAFVQKFVNLSPVPVEFVSSDAWTHEDNYGEYLATKNVIEIKRGLSQKQTFKTLISSIAEAMQKDDCNYKEKKLRAESVAFNVCHYLGIDTSEYSFGYIAEQVEGNIDTLMANMKAISQTTKELVLQLVGK